jgi:hypothetical protein
VQYNKFYLSKSTNFLSICNCESSLVLHFFQSGLLGDFSEDKLPVSILEHSQLGNNHGHDALGCQGKTAFLQKFLLDCAFLGLSCVLHQDDDL